jgi:hypothetical protein
MEQELIENLVIESIRIYGVDTWYIPRTLGAKDDLLNEDDLPQYNNAYMVEMYVKSVDGFEGEGDFLSKFGLQIRDSMTLTIAIRTFNQEVAAYSEQVRPFEGDIIYFPLNKKFFKVMHLEHEAIFYQLGQLQTYDLRCELLDYSGEVFNTGQSFIDDYFEDYRLTVSPDTVKYSIRVDAKSASNPYQQGSSASFYIGADESPHVNLFVGTTYFFDQSDTSNVDYPIEIHTSIVPSIGSLISTTYTGTPGTNSAGLTWTPTTAGSYYYLSSALGNSYMGSTISVGESKIDNIEMYDEVADNQTIESFADSILDFSETNPFGEDNY